jgi:drug/metabolite transporter (DMT)-like permease
VDIATSAQTSKLRTALLTCLALVAFAANSLLCRLALAAGHADPASFTAVRIACGAAMLWLLVNLRGRRAVTVTRRLPWLAAAFLFAYAIAFSFAYLSLSAGTGALILFGSVQLTMIAFGLRSGERPTIIQWLGLFLALSGLVYLLWPGLAAPPALAAFLMMLAGMAWGGYSLLGRGVKDPLQSTASNFLRALPFALAAFAICYTTIHVSIVGALLAAASGALASGLGYVIWYAALPLLSATRAASVQLAVPMLTALAGVLFLHEPLGWRLVVAGLAILGGIALAVLRRR